MRSALVTLLLLAAPVSAEPLLDHDPTVTCRAAHAAGAPGCPRHVRRRGQRLEITPIVFAYGKDVIRPASLPVLQDLALYLAAHPQLRVHIQGHSGFDERERAMRLSDRRARAIHAALRHFGVDAQRLQANGYGDSVPLVIPRTPADRARNTRIELHILP